MANEVLLEVEGNIATVVLNRPEVLNALNSGVWAGLEKAALRITSQPKIHVVILTGAGDRAFSVGLDLKATASGGIPTAGHRRRTFFDKLWILKQIFGMYEDLPVPVIAAINGYCIGAGVEFILCCDIRLASEHAMFALPEVDLGSMPDMGATQRLPQLLNPGYAKELIYTGRRIDAAEAWRIGLVNHVYPQGQLMTEARKLAEEIARKDTIVVQSVKKAIKVARILSPEAGQSYETALAVNVLGDGKKLAELAAALQKRK